MYTEKSRYIPFPQQLYCCVPACIQMVLYRRGIPLIAQEIIWKYLWLRIPKEKEYLFDVIKAGEEPKAWYWTQVSKYPISNFFVQNNIKLKEEYFFLDDIKTDIKIWIQDIIKNNWDILVCLNLKSLDEKSEDIWHILLIDSFDWDNIVLLDPRNINPKYRPVKFEVMINAISHHWRSRRWWFWVIK